jgi:3-deoxy-D-manno-octulosonate 8-phosphate phosphatase (KDO 8-P phosphatase)
VNPSARRAPNCPRHVLFSELTTAQRDALARAQLLALDVDGTLTDGRVVYVGENELQSFCVRDGQGLVWLRRAGVKLAWISGRGCVATERRARELGVEFLHLRCKDKTQALAAAQTELGIGPDQTLAMGDDLPDLALAKGACFLATPADGQAELRRRADLVTAAPSGQGAVRELCELCLMAKGLWEDLVDDAAR